MSIESIGGLLPEEYVPPSREDWEKDLRVRLTTRVGEKAANLIIGAAPLDTLAFYRGLESVFSYAGGIRRNSTDEKPLTALLRMVYVRPTAEIEQAYSEHRAAVSKLFGASGVAPDSLPLNKENERALLQGSLEPERAWRTAGAER